MPDEGFVLSDRVLLDQEVEIMDRSMLIDLKQLELSDFDMILGMDFLGRYSAKVDCGRKKVRFHIGHDHFVFGEGRVESMMISCI